jgi:molybdate transport system regulatory protein
VTPSIGDLHGFGRIIPYSVKSARRCEILDFCNTLATQCGKGDLKVGAWHSAVMATVRVSIVFESGARIGPGKAKLLESIRDTGSISAAAREMGMSYKRAWTLLDSINQAFTEPVTTAAPGGVGGGGAILTAFGVEVLERYRRIQDRTAALSADDLAVLADRARPDAGPKI